MKMVPSSGSHLGRAGEYPKILSLVLAIYLLTAVPAHAGPASRLPPGTAADPPRGFVDMCQRDRALCLVGLSSKDGAKGEEKETQSKEPNPSSGPSALAQADTGKTGGKVKPPDKTLNPRWALATRINRDVNNRVRQVSDSVVSGMPEYWQRPTGKRPQGDCEDIAIEKRVELLAAGFPAEDMFYAVVFRTGLGLHTVLVVRFDEGDYVLDSANPYVHLWSETHYFWLRQQSPTDPLRWTTVPAQTS